MADSTPNKQTVKNLSDKAKQYISLLKGELLAHHKAATYGLVNSLEFKLYDKVESIRIDWLYNDYATWVRTGQKPHWVPIQPLKNWAKAIGKDESFAYAVRYKIHEVGVKKFDFVENVNKASNFEEGLIKSLEDGAKLDIEDKLQEMIDKYFASKK